MGRSEEIVETAAPEIPSAVIDESTIAPEWLITTSSEAEESAPEPPPPTVVSTEPEDIKSLLVSNANDYEAMVESNQTRPQSPPPVEPPPPPVEVAPPSRAPETSLYTVHDSRRGLPIRNAGKVEKGVVVTILDEPEFRAGQVFNIRVKVENRSGATGKPLGG